MYGKDLIESLVERYSLTPPMDVDRICEGEGVDVTDAPLPGDLTAVYFRGIKRFPVILVRDGISESKRRQAIAHELAHHFLDEGGLYNLNQGFRSKKDYAAERFAHYLLLPDWLLPEWMDVNAGIDCAGAAAHFGVEMGFLQDRMEIYRHDLT